MTTRRFPSAAGRTAVAVALAEDALGRDITTAWSVSEDLAATAEVRTRQSGIAAGLPAVAEVFAQVDPEVEIEASVADGARLTDGDVLLRLSGPARSLITGERTALNFLQRLCGIATLTDRYVQAMAATKTRILDTRKTAPGLRALDKYAVTVGGGRNHRLDLGPAQGEPHRRGGRGDRSDRGGPPRDGTYRADGGGRCRSADRDRSC
ncbi:nicotinate-nucleotide diphosphorylase [Streptomyces sp. R28]|uniref:nicotinate-nucleotide diphosphorylase (carboxylating) n=1 Tax=Streptomyces sp. R28 TaxID=3238628 RepID=A0AB39PPB0_9ACTN